MIILLLVLSILVTAGAFVATVKGKSDSFCFVSIVTGIVGVCVTVLIFTKTLSYVDDVVSEKTIDEKIASYEKTNKKIQTQISALVQNYMEYEKDTFSIVKSEDCMSLVSLYPELKSNELVQSQISLYVKNNEKIRKLQGKKIDIGKSKWWLYFGK